MSYPTEHQKPSISISTAARSYSKQQNWVLITLHSGMNQQPDGYENTSIPELSDPKYMPESRLLFGKQISHLHFPQMATYQRQPTHRSIKYEHFK